MEKKTDHILQYYGNSLIRSYGQVFFSRNPVFAVILLIVTFFDMYAGIAGLLAVVFTNITALLFGLNKQKIYEGIYGFNSLLVGLGIGIYYQPGVEFYIILALVSMITLFFSVALEGVLGKYGLPYLSIPFLLGIWMVVIAAKGYSTLSVSERGVYSLNDMYAMGGMTMVRLYEWFNNLAVPESLRIYFKSLSAILFQYHMFAGILIGIGLLYYSRIAFLMSLIGFYTAYYFYFFIGADISELTYSYIGFNYILTAIAVGGFFIVPSWRSVLWVVLLTPLIAIILSSTSYIFAVFQLSVLSLPFNIVVILFLYVLKFRETRTESLSPVVIQQYSPEEHAYNHNNYMERFGSLPWFAMNLPFWGEWKVTQGHNGEHTHQKNWQHAWDFEIVDEKNQPFDNSGNRPEDYYCFNKPVSAPADGLVVEIEDGIDDNVIGDMNLEKNWGNSVVIKHAEGLYSQLSHLKKESIKVTVDQAVKQGEVIGHCGNSGRSPVPHIHMQFQETPSIGSATVKYPLSAFVVHEGNSHAFQTATIPEMSQVVSNPVRNEYLFEAYHFVPGQVLKFEKEEKGKKQDIEWVVESDIYKNTSLYCKNTKSKAYFRQLGNVFYFTSFEGKKNSLLYYFYLSSFKVVTAFYKDLKIADAYPLSLYPGKFLKIIQDFCVPFFRFLDTTYELTYDSFSENGEDAELIMRSKAFLIRKKSEKPDAQFTITVETKGIHQINVNAGEQQIIARRLL